MQVLTVHLQWHRQDHSSSSSSNNKLCQYTSSSSINSCFCCSPCGHSSSKTTSSSSHRGSRARSFLLPQVSGPRFLGSCSSWWPQCTMPAMHSCILIEHASQCWCFIQCSQQCTGRCSSRGNYYSIFCSLTVNCRCWMSRVGANSTVRRWFVCWE